MKKLKVVKEYTQAMARFKELVSTLNSPEAIKICLKLLETMKGFLNKRLSSLEKKEIKNAR